MGGAVEKIWFALGKEFASRGHQVIHISRQHEMLKKDEVIDGVHHIRIPGFDTPHSLIKLKWYDLLYSRRAVKMIPKTDILVTNTFWLPVLAPQDRKGKIYVHVQRFPKGQMKFYSKAARLQTVSTVIRNAICREAPRLAARVKVIPNFVSRRNLALAEDSRANCILYVGRIHPEKGIHLLIEAFEKLLSAGFSDWRLRLVGPWDVALGGGGENYHQSLRKKASRIEKCVEWIGPVFDTDLLRAHYRESSFFVYPSLAGRGEASPLAPLEAMAEGCPPVVSSLECFRDYIEPERNGWVFGEQPPDGVVNLAKILQRLAGDSEVVRRVRDQASRAAQRFALPSIADRYLSDFEEIIGQ